MENSRINWIDWAKFIAITMVVLGHIPQEDGSFLPLYVCTFHIPFFFFISGYLTKPRLDTKEEIKKCTHSLVIPYVLYNIIFYPYWAIRLYIDRGVDLSIYNYIIKPIIGLFFLQINTPISSSVNGAMWFIAVLLIMRFAVHFCLQTSKPSLFLIVIATISVGIYVYISYHRTPVPLTIDGLFRCMPLYIIGYLSKHYHWIEKIALKTDIIMALILITISVGSTYLCNDSYSFTYQMIAFYTVLFTASFGFLYFCKALNSLKSSIIVNISIGTLMIMGLHWMYIGTTNFILEHLLDMNTGITYSWPLAILFALCIDAAIYPLIIWAIKYMPILLGK